MSPQQIATHDLMIRPASHLEDAEWLHVADATHIRWTGRPSRFTIAGPLLVTGAVALLGVGLTYWLLPIIEGAGVPQWGGMIPLSLTLFAAINGVKIYLAWRRHLYVITDEEIYVRDGLLSREITQVPLDRVQNASFDQSLLERLLGFGDVHIFTAGSSTEDLTFESVPQPHHVAETLTTTHSDQRDQQPDSLGAI